MSEITREEYQTTMARLHERVDKIAETGIKIETYAKLMKESVDKICTCLYGNSENGLIQKVTKLFERVNLHTKIIVGALLAIIAGFVSLIFK